MQKVLSFAKSPVLWVGLVIGAVLALAYGRFFGPVKAVAKALPKSEA